MTYTITLEKGQEMKTSLALGHLGVVDDTGFFVASLLSNDSLFLNAQRIEVRSGIMI